MLKKKSHQFLLKQHIKDHQSAKNKAGNSVGGKKSQVYFTQIVWFDQGVLIEQHAQKNRCCHPMYPVEVGKL